MMHDAEEYARARRVLMRRDPVLAATISRIGACGMAIAQLTDHLTTLVARLSDSSCRQRPPRRSSAGCAA